MAKGRKHGLLHRERLLGSFSHAHGHSAAVADLPDLVEEDVWSTMTADDSGGGEEASGEEGWYGDFAWRPSGSGSGGGGGGSRSQERRQVGGLSLAFDGSGGDARPRVVHQYRNADSSGSWGDGIGGRRHHQVAASAPVSVPGWPGSAHRVEAAESPPSHTEFDDGEWVPPHEYLAREYSAASSGRSATGSVVEGVGRTLKGRDLRRLRDAVWSQTGFYG
ncbi:hypothetical protein Taro_044338 [Colocasia esculenta]|uniref:Senescence regulator n=1 Tax=Colocasia esculenta TaxID=4460 RepID=A0A843X0L5_COLES|nr:hypothetical protein [Colocasia esculenta]